MTVTGRLHWLQGYECPLCATNKPIYQFNNTCCRARFLIEQPTKAYRQDWLKRWEKELDAETMDEIKRLTIKLWEAKTAT